MSKTLEMAKKFHQMDERFREKTGRELGALAGLMERRRAWGGVFNGLPDGDISPKQMAQAIGFNQPNRFRRSLRTDLPRTKAQLFALYDKIMPRILRTSARAVVKANGMSSTRDIDKTLRNSRMNMGLDGLRYGYPPELIEHFSELISNAPAGADWKTENYLAKETGMHNSWIRARIADRLPTLPRKTRKDDGNHDRTHYPEITGKLLIKINRDEKRRRLSAVALEFGAPLNTISYRAKRLGLEPEYRTRGAVGIYSEEDIQNLRANLINFPIRRHHRR